MSSEPVGGVTGPTAWAPLIVSPKTKKEWLESTYLAHDGYDMTVSEYCDTGNAEDEVKSYWQDPHINWALELLRRKHANHKDVHIMFSALAASIYSMATSPDFFRDGRDSEYFRQNWAPVLKELEGKNIIVIPVNNGFKQGLGSHIPTEGISEKERPQHQEAYERYPGWGAHWSFMVVDRRNQDRPTAHYFDGMVQTTANKTRKGGWKIGGTDMNGEVAGQVLCGFDNLLGLTKGEFDARTMKFTPHMVKSNEYHGKDHGVCGPHMYAFLDHLLTNKETLINPGLETMFNNPRVRSVRNSQFKFNSMKTRAKFELDLMQERRRQERLQPGNCVDNLTPEVLRSIMTVDLLLTLTLAADPPQAPVPPPPTEKVDGTGLKSDENNDDDDEDYEEDRSEHKDLKKLYKEAKENGTLPDNIKNFDDFNVYRAQEQSIVHEAKSKSKSKSNMTTVVIDNVTYSIPNDDKDVWRPPTCPSKGTAWPDFAKITDSHLNRIAQEDEDIGSHQDRYEGHNTYTSRAMLHIKHNKTFLTVPDEDFIKVYKDDGIVFKNEPPQDTPASKLRYIMMRHYEPEMLELIKKYALKPAKSAETAYSGPHTKQSKLVYPKGFTKDNLPNFAMLKSSDCTPWVNLYKDDLFKQARSQGRTYMEERAVLHRTYKGSFKGESRASLLQHLDIPDLFASGELTANPTDADIADRLDEVYWKLEAPFFADLSDKEIDHWVERLHEDMRTPMNGADGKIWYNRARGILHRMFVGEFSDMSEEQLTRWRLADPYIHPKYKDDNETALVYMNIIYRIKGSADLPWLRESPLHWPRLEHRLTRSAKRKRYSPDGKTSGGKRQKTQESETTRSTLPEEPRSTSPKKTARELKAIKWANMTEADINKYVTDDVRGHPSIGSTPNSYTYRAILFVRSGGTFKDTSQEINSKLWVRDTNVFTHGHEDGTPGIDLALKEDGTLKVNVYAPHAILRRMAAKYEPSGALSTLVDWDAMKVSTVSFARMPAADVKEWVTLQATDIPGIVKLSLWKQKTVLQARFGGFRDLPDGDLRYWQNNDRFFRELKKDPGWSIKDVAPALEERLSDVKARDFRGVPLYYPEYYQTWFAENIQTKMAPRAKTPQKQNFGSENIDIMEISDDEEEEEEDDDDDQTIAAKAKQKKQEDDAYAKANTPEAIKARFSKLDFLTMADDDLKLWLDKLPAELKPHLHSGAEWVSKIRARAWLTRIFTTLFQDMQAEPDLSDASIATLKAWMRARPTSSLSYSMKKKADVRRFLDRALMSQTVATVSQPGASGTGKPPREILVELPDYSNVQAKWPDYWLKGVADLKKVVEAEEAAKRAAEMAKEK